MFSYRAQGFLAIGIGAISLAACGTPDLATNLRPDGPPEVLAVMVQIDQTSDNGGVPNELSTFCKTNDNLVPTVVGLPDFSVDQVCPDDHTMQVPEVTDADPLAWLVRVMFDELLDPNIETLVAPDGGPCTTSSDSCVGHLDTTLPMTVTCAGVNVPYDGYYVPNGNNVSWPVGPNLTIFPIDATTIATGSECSVTVNDNVVDKDGIAVPSDQRGPYKFKISPLAIIGTSPDPTDAGGTPPSEALTFTPKIGFNAFVDIASLDAGEVTLHDDTADAAVAFTATADQNTLVITPDAALVDGDDYTMTITDGSTFADVAGGGMTQAGDLVLQFTGKAS